MSVKDYRIETQTDNLQEILHALLKHWQIFCNSLLFWREKNDKILKETAYMSEAFWSIQYLNQNTF